MVITSEMNSRDATALTRESVDISSVLSFDNQISFGIPESGGGEKKAASSGVCCDGTYHPPKEKETDKLTPAEAMAETVKKAASFLPSVNVGVNTKHSRRSLSSSEKKDTVKSKITKTSTVSADLLLTSRVNMFLMSLSQYAPLHKFCLVIG
jgi:hypothetical protein